MADIALRGNKLTAGRAGFGLGSVVKGVKNLGKVLSKKKPVPKPGPQNKFKYQGKDPTKESWFDFVDRKDAKAAWESGDRHPPFKIPPKPFPALLHVLGCCDLDIATFVS